MLPPFWRYLARLGLGNVTKQNTLLQQVLEDYASHQWLIPHGLCLCTYLLWIGFLGFQCMDAHFNRLDEVACTHGLIDLK